MKERTSFTHPPLVTTPSSVLKAQNSLFEFVRRTFFVTLIAVSLLLPTQARAQTGTLICTSTDWTVDQFNGEIRIFHKAGTQYPQYAVLHLADSYFRLNYGLGSGWGTSVILMPAFWSNGQYYQRTPISVPSCQFVDTLLQLTIQGTNLGLTTTVTVKLSHPTSSSISAAVTASTSGSVPIDTRPGEAFKPVTLSSMHESNTMWDAKRACVESTCFSFPSSGWIVLPTQVLNSNTFHLVGGTSSWKTNAPTIVISNLNRASRTTGWVTNLSDPNEDNVAFWAAVDNVLSSWSYTIVAQLVGDTTGVFRPSNGLLYLKNTNDTGIADLALNYGIPGDDPVVGDWDGNGTVTIGIYRQGTFYLRNSNTIGFAEIVFPFQQAGDQPIAGDWNGDGVDTIGVFRPSNGQFFLRNSNSEGPAQMSFYLGNVGDVGIAGDWDGDGLDTTGVFRPSNGLIYLKNQNTTGFADIALNYGIPGDKPVTGDWNGDGIDTIGVYRNGLFYLRNENTIGFAEIIFGLGNPGDMPIAGDWDGVP